MDTLACFCFQGYNVLKYTIIYYNIYSYIHTIMVHCAPGKASIFGDSAWASQLRRGLGFRVLGLAEPKTVTPESV